MRASYPIAFAIPAIPIDSLDCIVPLSRGSRVVGWNAGANRHHAKLLLLIHRLPGLARCEEVTRLRFRLSSVWREVGPQHRSWEVFRNFDLDITEVAFSGSTLALLLIGIVGLGRSWRASLESAVPVVRDKGLALVALRGTVGVDIIHMGEICFEPATYWLIVYGDIWRQHLLLFAQGNHLVHIEQLLAPFREARRVDHNFGAEVAIALLIGPIRRAKYIVLLLQSAD
jgi:hypothetical protein